MRKFPNWGYFLFMAILAVGSTVYLRDFFTATLIFSIMLSDPLYQKLSKAKQQKWLIPYGVAFALVLGGFYYSAELVVFPHSTQAMYRLRNACADGLLLAFAGFLTAHWSSGKNRNFLTTSGQ